MKKEKSFNRILKAVSVLIVLMCAVMMFAACDYEAAYDNDAKIINSSGNIRTASVKTDILGVYKETTKKFSGVDTLKELNLSENPTIDFDLTINSGKFKIVLVKGETVTLLTEESVTGGKQIELEAGRYKLKIVGVEANFVLTLRY